MKATSQTPSAIELAWARDTTARMRYGDLRPSDPRKQPAWAVAQLTEAGQKAHREACERFAQMMVSATEQRS